MFHGIIVFERSSKIAAMPCFIVLLYGEKFKNSSNAMFHCIVVWREVQKQQQCHAIIVLREGMEIIMHFTIE